MGLWSITLSTLFHNEKGPTMPLFNVSTEMMTLFYRSVIESVIMFCIATWYGNLNLATMTGSVALSRWPVRSQGGAKLSL